MTQASDSIMHRRLACGVELAVQPLPDRPLAALEIRLLAGFAYEEASSLGAAHLLEETITKGTERRDGRAVNDAFDEIGAAHGSSAGRETIGFSAMCLPEFLDRCLDLHAEFIRTPTFPEDACGVAVELARQELVALEDDPAELARKLLHRRAYGEPLGRHALGEPETIERMTRDSIAAHWRSYFAADRMLVAVAGAVDADRLADHLDRVFEGFSANGPANPGGDRDPDFAVQFTPGRFHHPKELEQEQVALCFPGACPTDDDFPVEKVALGVLAGGMSSRLFTEVREKQGLVYWVDAWSDHPRKAGMVHLAASSTPQNVGRTYATLLREIDRLAEDLTDEEIERAIVGIVARTRTRGDVTRARAARLVDDLFYYGRPIPLEEKIARIEAVTADDVRRYLATHPRDALSVVTLGPQPLES